MEHARTPVTILRPCAVYGRHARALRESWFLKRMHDGRAQIPIAYNGDSTFHTSSTAGIAAGIECALRSPENSVLNVADPHALSVPEIGDAISAVLGKPLPIHPFDGGPVGSVGRTPWSVPRLYVLDTQRANALGWDGGKDYAEENRRCLRLGLMDGRARVVGQMLPFV